MGPQLTQDPCASAACPEKCQCGADNVDLASCLADGDCAAVFACATQCACVDDNKKCAEACTVGHQTDFVKQLFGQYEAACYPTPQLTQDPCASAACPEKCQRGADNVDLAFCWQMVIVQQSSPVQPSVLVGT